MKVQYSEGQNISMMKAIKANKHNLEKTIQHYISGLDFKAEDYKDSVVVKLAFSYIPVIEKDPITNKPIKHKTTFHADKKQIVKPTPVFRGYNLPNTYDFLTWEVVISKPNNKYIVERPNTKMLYVITKNLDHNLISIMANGEIILNFKDIKGNNMLSFQREIDNNSSKYVFKNGELVLKQLNKKTKYMSAIKTDKLLINNFLTLDIETYKDNKMIPYCISNYNGRYAETFYLTHFKNPTEMMSACISTLLHSRFNGHNIYVHNLSLFDGVFLLGVLASMKNCTIRP